MKFFEDCRNKWREGVVIKQFYRSLLFFDDGGLEYFIPYSIVMDWYTDNKAFIDYDINELPKDAELSVELPIWFLKKENVL
jgi:hypothetical protein